MKTDDLDAVDPKKLKTLEEIKEAYEKLCKEEVSNVFPINLYSDQFFELFLLKISRFLNYY